MTFTCLLHNQCACSKQTTIDRARTNKYVKIVHAFDWSSQSDNTTLIYEEVMSVIDEIGDKFPSLKFRHIRLGGKDGSIYCDICRQIRSADIGIFDVSTQNLNVILELGLAIGAGIYIFILRSRHSRRRQRSLSDLNGILEYRFSRKSGRLKFEANFKQSLKNKLLYAAKRRLKK